MQTVPGQHKEGRHRQPPNTLRISVKAEKEIAQLPNTYPVQIKDKGIHPLCVLQPVLIPAINKATAQGKAVLLHKLRIVLLPSIMIHLPSMKLLIFSLVEIHSTRMREVTVLNPIQLVVGKQLPVKVISTHLLKLSRQVLIASSVIFGHVKPPPKEKEAKRKIAAAGRGKRGSQRAASRWSALKRKSPPPFPPRSGHGNDGKP